MELNNIITFLSENFEFWLVIDENGKILEVSDFLCNVLCCADEGPIGSKLSEILIPVSYTSFLSAMDQVKGGNRAARLFVPKNNDTYSIPLRINFEETPAGPVYYLFGSMMDRHKKLDISNENEGIKELTCLYSVDEWIDISSSVNEFFKFLPDYLSPGFKYPESILVYSCFNGIEYGKKCDDKQSIRVSLDVNKKLSGEIRVAYDEEDKVFLLEEIKMLNKFGSMLSMALERKELSDRLLIKQKEVEDFNRKLDDLQEDIAVKSRELQEQKDKLKKVDMYFYRINNDWEKSRLRLETMFEAIPDNVVLIDVNYSVIMSKRKTIQTGQKCYQTLYGLEHPCSECILDRILKTRTLVSLVRNDDNKFIAINGLPIYNDDDQITGIMEFYRDVTLEKTYEQQLQQADKLASLGQLVSGIGHEINNPNQFIQGNTKIIKQALDDIIPILDEYFISHPDLKIARLQYGFFREHVPGLVDDMAHGSERIKNIIDSLRSFARKDEGLLIDHVELNSLVSTSVRLVRNEVHKKAAIDMVLSEDNPSFQGNFQKMEQVLINFLVNAAQSIPEGRKGKIVVTTAVKEGEAFISIVDNGKGMNDETQKRIFDPFFTTKRGEGGTGLGLAIAYRIVEEHNGRINVFSKSGEGTTFTVHIPLSLNQEGERVI